MSLIVDGLLKTIAALDPKYASMINFFLAHEDEFEKLAPIADAAVKEGPGAFAAAENAAPELAQAIRDFIDILPLTASAPADAKVAHRENVARQLVGISKDDDPVIFSPPGS